MSKDEVHDRYDEGEDSNVYGYLLRYKGELYNCDLVEVTKDTAYFQVDAKLVRKGLFPKNRLDLRWFREMGIKLIPIHNPPIEEQ